MRRSRARRGAPGRCCCRPELNDCCLWGEGERERASPQPAGPARRSWGLALGGHCTCPVLLTGASSSLLTVGTMIRGVPLKRASKARFQSSRMRSRETCSASCSCACARVEQQTGGVRGGCQKSAWPGPRKPGTRRAASGNTGSAANGCRSRKGASLRRGGLSARDARTTAVPTPPFALRDAREHHSPRSRRARPPSRASGKSPAGRGPCRSPGSGAAPRACPMAFCWRCCCCGRLPSERSPRALAVLPSGTRDAGRELDDVRTAMRALPCGLSSVGCPPPLRAPAVYHPQG